MVVAIDGPAGAGKSTVARRIAEELGFRYLDTGAMYRALTWLAIERSLSLDDGPRLAELGRGHPVAFRGDTVLVAGTDVTTAIREARIDRVVSSVARHPEVRVLMRERQRELANEGDAVVEGRDIGTVVCPDAELKVYLVADERERARRRASERPSLAGDALATDLRWRDERDAAQLRAAADAVEIDTTSLTVDDVVAKIVAMARGRSDRAG